MTERELPMFRAPLRRLTGVAVIGVGGCVPDKVVTNEDLARMGCDPEWIVRRTGIHERRHVSPGMSTSDLAATAGERCIQQSGVDRSEIDLVIVGTFTPDVPMPATANRVQHKLGLCAGAMDVQAACSGFFYGLVTAMQYIATGCSRMALVIGADCNSRVVDPNDVKTYPLFGDGAGAVLLRRGTPEQGMVGYTLGADGSGFELLICPMGGSRMPASVEGVQQGAQYLKMDGRPVFKWAVRLVVATINDVLETAGMKLADIDLFILHQANVRILDAVARELGIDPARMVINMDRYGNTSSGSIPLAIDECWRQGRIKPGCNIVAQRVRRRIVVGNGLVEVVTNLVPRRPPGNGPLARLCLVECCCDG